MMKKKTTNLFFLLLLLFIVISMGTMFLSFRGVPTNRDSGAYLLTAKEMLSGKSLYTDIWEHKPPLHLWINLLGYIVGKVYGVWLLQLIIIVTSFSLMYVSLRKVSNRFIDGFFTISLSYLLFAIGFKENVPELEILFFQSALLFFVSQTFFDFNKYRRKKIPLVIGILGAGLFLTKFNFIGTFIASVLTIAYFSFKAEGFNKALLSLFNIGTGFFFPLLIVSSMFSYTGLFSSFIDNVFVYNYYYANSLSISTIFVELFGKYSFYGGLVFTVLSIIFTIIMLLFVKNLKASEFPHKFLITWALISFLFDIFAIISTGRFYLQYLIPLIIPGSIFLVFFINKFRNRRFQIILSVVALIAAESVFVFNARGRIENIKQDNEVTKKIDAMTNSSDIIFVWGAEPQLYLLSMREYPGKYMYIYPIITKKYTTTEMLCGFFDKFSSTPPKLIIDTSKTNYLVPSLYETETIPSESTSVYYVPLLLQQFITEIRDVYVPVTYVGEWVIWQRSSRWYGIQECKGNG